VSGTILPATLINSSNVVEQIHITAHTANSDTLTVTRAANGTSAKAWSAGDRIEVRLTSEFLNIAALLFGSADTAASFSLLPTATTLAIGAGASVALNIGHASAAAAFPGGISIPTGKTLSGAGGLGLTGVSVLGGSRPAAPPTYVGTLLLVGTSGPQASGGLEFQYSTAGDGYGFKLYTDAATDTFGIARRSNSATWTSAIKLTDAGVVTIANLAGVGTRNVVVDANGVLSAP
jgi:hypothetical protein